MNVMMWNQIYSKYTSSSYLFLCFRMGQNMNEGVRYFKDVLFVESEIFVASLVWNLTLLEAERRLYPIN